jgi:hypothetical protein
VTLKARNPEPYDPIVEAVAKARIEPPEISADTVADVWGRYALNGRAPTPKRAQVRAILAMERARNLAVTADGPQGIVGMVGCGHGKTLIAHMAPAIFGASYPLLLVPAAVKPQFEREARKWSAWYPTDLPADSVLSYESLSSPKATRLLDARRPDLIVCDEAHYLSSTDSSRWKRLNRYLASNPDCRLVILSGTLIRASIGDFAHLVHWALRGASPLPHGFVAGTLAAVINAAGEPRSSDLAYVARVLAAPYGHPSDRDGCRAGFRDLLARTPGFVVSPGLSADTSIRGSLFGGPERPESLAEALAKLGKDWVLPDDTALVDGLEFDRYSRQLTFGFYSRWKPGTLDERWVSARKAWGGVIKSYVTYGSYDSPAIVEDAAKSGNLSNSAHRAYADWVSVRGMEPESETVWLESGKDFSIRLVREALSEAGPDALVWYRSTALGAVLSAILPTHGAGSRPPTDGSAAVSVPVHGTGWDGWRYHKNIVLEPPTNAAQMEQLISRTHRTGQTRDVLCWFYVGSPYLRKCLGKIGDGARFIGDTTGEPQRWAIMDWVGPTPG